MKYAIPIAGAAALVVPAMAAPAAHAWVVYGSTAATCNHIFAHIDANSSKPLVADARLRAQINGGTPFFEALVYNPQRQDFAFGSRIPQDGGTYVVRTSLIDHDGDETAVNTTTVGPCGQAPTPPVTPPVVPSTPPKVTPPPPPPCPVTGKGFTVKDTGHAERTIVFRHPADSVRVRVNGERVRLRNGRFVVKPGDHWRVTADFGCVKTSRRGHVPDTPPPPPIEAG